MKNQLDGAQDEYRWDGRPPHNHSYLAPGILDVLGRTNSRRIIDLGCGNGTLTEKLAGAGYDTTGVDFSPSGVKEAAATFPAVKFEQHDLDDPMPEHFHGQFDAIVAAEVIEHMFLPRKLFARAAECLKPGGEAVISTPYHGYWKNLALAVTNKYDHHWRPSWDYGHIKFFSVETLEEMARECGFEPVEVKRVGRVPALAKTMIMRAKLV